MDNYNDLVIIGKDLGLVDIILHGLVENHRIANDVVVAFIDIGSNQRGQVSEKTCDTYTGDNITSLKFTAQFPGGAEAFINQWDKGIE